MAQAKRYDRSHDFTADDEFQPQHMNDELDAVSVSVNRLKENQEAVLLDDNTLKPGIITIENLGPDVIKAFQNVSLEAQDDALQAAQEAKESAEAAASEKEAAAGYAAAAESTRKNVEIESQNLITELRNIASEAETDAYGVTCSEICWTVGENVAEGSTITIPGGFQYIVGRKHVLINWNGVELQRDVNFSEVGSTDTKSSQIKVLMPLTKGDQMRAWAAALGRGNTSELLPLIQSNTDAIADLSSKVVYKSEQAAS